MKAAALGSPIALSVTAAPAQGTVQFKNLDPAIRLNAPVYHANGELKVSGNQYVVELFAGTNIFGLSAVGTTGFSTGTDAGYFDGGTRTINGIPGGAKVFVQVRVWNTLYGSTFAVAQNSFASDAWGESSVFSVTLGDPNASPPKPPAGLSTLVSFNLDISLSQPPAPILSIVPAGDTMVLSWPGGWGYQGYILECSTNLVSGVWSTNLLWPVVTSNAYTVTIRTTSAQGFFRLAR